MDLLFDNKGRKDMRKEEIFWCKNCLNMSTRPRITFDNRGYCNACQWLEEKKIMDWGGERKRAYRPT